MNLDDQIKIAERDKNLAEIQKLLAERDKLYFELEETKKESKRKWFKKNAFKQSILLGLIGIGFLGFYITYAVIPAFQVESLHYKLENEKKADSLYKKQKKIDSEDSTLQITIRNTDSFKSELLIKEIQFDSLQKSRHKLDSSVQIIINEYKKDLSLKNQKLKN